MRDLRPRLHITPCSGWLNDPNGLCRIDGTWHVFHQFNPVGPTWGPPRWAHLTSQDLVHWTEQPTALAPEGVGPDAGGIWSGCVVDDHGTPTAVYTGVEATADGGWTQTVCLATSDRSLLTWTRDPANPVIAGPLDPAAIGFRDPWVFPDGDGWTMLIGTGVDPDGGKVALFHGPDLRSWTFQGYLLERAATETEPTWTGRMWECPQLARSNGTDILVWSVWDDQRQVGQRVPAELHYPVVATGRVVDGAYRVDTLQRLDHGADCYAPAFLVDGDRIIVWGWSWESLTEAGRTEQGWAGALTFPRVLWATPDGELRQAPAAELRALRGVPATHGPTDLGAGGVRSACDGQAVEVFLRARPRDGRVHLDVLADPDGRERTRISYDAATHELAVDCSRASRWSEAIGGRQAGRLDLGASGALELTVLVDVSIVEVFAGQRLVFTDRVYPTLEASTGIVVSGEGAALLDELTVWPLD